MTNAINKSWIGLFALLTIGLFTVIISCEDDDAVPVYPKPDNYELADYLGAYQVVDDACHDGFVTYSIAILKRSNELGHDEVVISNFGKEGEDLKAHMNNGRLEIYRQRRYVKGFVCDVEGYVYPNDEGGLKFFIFRDYEDYWGPKSENCEVSVCCRTCFPQDTPNDG